MRGYRQGHSAANEKACREEKVMTREAWPPAAIRKALEIRQVNYLRLMGRKLKAEGHTKFMIDSEMLVAQDNMPVLIFGPTKTVEEIRIALQGENLGEEWKGPAE